MSIESPQRVVTKRQLNQETAKVLDSITADEPIVVTEHGKPSWTIYKYPERQLSGMERLRALGMVTEPSDDPPPFPEHGVGQYTSEEIDRLLEEMSGDY